MTIKQTHLLAVAAAAGLGLTAVSAHTSETVASDDIIAEQRDKLARATIALGFGPQAPRDIDAVAGSNDRVFETAPPYSQMNLCNIHFHEGAEHKGGEFTTYAGNGNGEGYGSGYLYSGELTESELAPLDFAVGESEHGDLQPGDTIEVHYVFSSAQVTPGPTLGSCLSEAINNPQLRVEAAVYVLVNDSAAADFVNLTSMDVVDGFHQAVNIPTDMGTPVQYAGSTTGPGYNEKGSPFQVSWSVRPNVKKVNIATVPTWFRANPFQELHAHGVRNLVMNPDLLSPIGQ